MSIIPLITFKAGTCNINTDTKPHKVKAQSQQGYIFLHAEDDLIHFCWRPRSQPIDEEAPIDLVMVPGDGRFVPYEYTTTEQPTSKTNGRIFVLKFNSSSQRYLFWLQSKPQGPSGDAAFLSARDRKIGDIVDRLLQGDEVDVTRELASVRSGGGGGGNDDSGGRRDDDDDDDDDETMEDVEGRGDPHDHHQSGAGGAGPDATGGDVRREGEDAREGGADGARAASRGVTDSATAAVVQNFLNSLKGSSSGLGGSGGGDGQPSHGKMYPFLNDLLEAQTTIPVIEAADEAYVDNLLSYLPNTVLVLAVDDQFDGEPTATAVASAREAMSLVQKKGLLKQVLRSPQFQQSLASLTVALRDGGLPSIAEALGFRVENQGMVRGGSVPLGGGEAVEAFVEGVKRTVKENR